MRKVLSFMLVLAMILGSFSMVFALEFPDVDPDAKYHDAVAVLSDLDVVSGYTDGNYKPDNVVTRAEMASLIIKALGIAPAASATTRFPDVPSTHWASGYIAYASSLGILKGYTDGTFKPEKPVSYDEAITMLIQALGYTIDSLTGTYPAAFVSKAKALGILENITALGTVGANRGDIAIMLYNTLGQKIGHVNDENHWEASDPLDVMLFRLGAFPIDPIVITYEEAEEALIDITELVGACVTPYVNKDWKILAIYAVHSEFKEGGLDIDGGTFGDYKFTNPWVGPRVAEWGEDQYVYFENGETIEYRDFFTELPGHPDELPDGYYTIAGEFSGKYLKTVYSVMAWNPTKTAQMTANRMDKLAKGDLLGYGFVLDDNDEVKAGSYQIFGVEALDDIEKGNIVTVYVNSVAAGEKITRIEVGTEVVTGKITAKNSKGQFTIEGKKYFADAALVLNVGDEGDFYLGYDGVIYAVELTDTTLATNYGVIIKTAEGGGLDESFLIKLLTAEGKKQNFTAMEAGIDAGLKANWGLAADNGLVVAYQVNADGIITSIKPTAAPVVPMKFKVTKTGVFDGHYFANDAVIFADETPYTGVTPFKADGLLKLSVVKASDLYGQDLALHPVHYLLNDAGQIIVMMFDGGGVVATTDVYGVWQGAWEYDGTVYSADFMIDGETKTYSFATQAHVVADANKKQLCEITVDEDGVISVAITPQIVPAVDLTTAGSLTGLTFKAGDGTIYSLATDVNVYTFAGNKAVNAEIDVLTEASATLKAYFFDVDLDGAYDYVLVK